jgi:hypothetical protein
MPLTPEQQARLDRLIEALRRMPSREGLLNVYHSDQGEPITAAHEEVGPEADAIRTHNLRAYLTALLERGSDVLLCGEAPGFFGATYSGISFSSEREIAAGDFPFADCRLLPGAQNGTRPLMKESSALYIWRAMARMKVPAVLWNSLQNHPFPPGHPTKNRTPRPDEILLGQESLQCMLDLVQPRMIVAIGRTGQNALAHLGLDVPYVRHPANAGSTQMMEMLEELGLLEPPPPPAQASLF